MAAKDEQIAKLESQIQEMQAAQPSLGSTGKQPQLKPGEFEDAGAKFRKYLETGKRK